MSSIAWKFPNDQAAPEYSYKSFMLGKGIMLTPVLEVGIKKLYVYFPNADWYNFETGIKVMDYIEGQEGKFMEIEA